MEEEFLGFVCDLFETYSFVDLKRTSHLTKQKAEKRTNYFFKTVVSSTDEMLLLIGTYYFKKLLDSLKDRIDDKKFVCWFVLKIFLTFSKGSFGVSPMPRTCMKTNITKTIISLNYSKLTASTSQEVNF
jgi:hypothetical protein